MAIGPLRNTVEGVPTPDGLIGFQTVIYDPVDGKHTSGILFEGFKTAQQAIKFAETIEEVVREHLAKAGVKEAMN